MSRELEIELELRIAMKAVRGLIASGYSVGVNDGEDTVLKCCKNPKKIKEALFSTDEDYLIAYKDGKKCGWVWLVWGNVQDVISDYSMNLDPALKDANTYAEQY
jgi:hypothetical protein